MKRISNEEYDSLMSFMKTHILNLWHHENKVRSQEEQLNSTQTGFSVLDICKYSIENGLSCYVVYSSTFLKIINHYLPNAIEINPDKFGTGNACDIIFALYKTSGFYPHCSMVRYCNFLSNTPCYIIYQCNGVFDNDILRIDLFRMIKDNKMGGSDFVGGLFHALKHFSMNGVNLSTGKDINDVFDVSHVIYLIAMAFRLKLGEGTNYEAEQQLYSKEHVLQYRFYKEEESGVFFLKTCHLKKRQINLTNH